jgi:GntR family transcriptional regulator / MocR family aminotransferase
LKKPGKVSSIDIRLESSLPLQRQLYSRLRDAIIHGRLHRGTRLPSSRTLARRLGVSRNTVLFAYEELAADEVLSGAVGSGTRVDRGVRVARFSDPDGLTLECLGLP